jgi:ABC-type transport system involved in resistance to organic solvents, permease component
MAPQSLNIKPARLAPVPEGLALSDGPGGERIFAFSHQLNAPAVSLLWTPAHAALADLGGAAQSLTLNVSAVDYMDGSGMALLVSLRAMAKRAGAKVQVVGLSDQQAHLLELAEGAAGMDDAEEAPAMQDRRGGKGMFTKSLPELYASLRLLVCFVGECSLVLYESLRHPERVRWKDVILSCMAVGVESMPILLLIGFLMGLIMSFQSVITLERFGGEIYVPNMLGLVMFREMGPLVTAILLAARSGSAFAAEIGTMRVNEELDALSTMGISPVRFLVGPRILSSLIVVPFMTLFFNFASLIGGALVMLSIGFPLVTFTSRVFANVGVADLVGSIGKIIVFSLLVAGVSCLRGLRTGGGASAVGRSTTAAVVSGLILITVADGLFAVLFYYFKI